MLRKQLSARCDCAAQVNRELLAGGHAWWVEATLDFGQGGAGRCPVQVGWRPGAKRRRGERLPVLFGDYCPFCGVRYPTSASAAASEEPGAEAGEEAEA